MTRYRRLLCFAVAAGFWGNPSLAQSRDAEAARVYSAAFDFLFGQYKGEFPRTVVLFDSTSWDAANVAYKGVIQQPHSSAVDPESIKDFEDRNHVAAPVVRSAFSYRLPIVMMSFPEFLRLDTLGRKILKKNPWSTRPDTGNAMDAFAVKYPHAWGITGVSRVGFNSARTQAMVFVGNNCGFYCYHTETLVFRKVGLKWVLQERIPFRSQDGPGVGETRYLGVNPQFLPRQRRVQDSASKAVADSIRRDGAPRRVKGTVTSRVTGKPFPNAQIFVRAREPLPAPRAVTDSRGRYELRNLPIGTIMLELQCPGAHYMLGATLDAPSFYLFPAADTIVNMTVPDMKPCWLPRRVHRIESGELAEDLRGITQTSSEDVSVFAAIVASLYPPVAEGKPAVLVTQRTYQRCRRLAECPSVKFDAMAAAGIVDSSAVKNFRMRSREVFATSRQQGDAGAISLLSLGERRYFEDEANWAGYMHAPESGASGFWTTLNSVYPTVSSIVSFTAPGFDAAGRQALVNVTAESRDGREADEILLLEKESGRWSIQRHLESMTLSAGFSAGRCVPVFSSAIPSISDLTGISGDYRFAFVPDVGNAGITEWRARFSPDTTPLPKAVRERLSAEDQQRLMRERLPIFEVLDPKTGSRLEFDEPGTYLESAHRRFRSRSELIQLDGSGYFIDIRGVGDGTLFGSWQAFSFGVRQDREGFVFPEPAGHFCAERITATTKSAGPSR